MEWIDKPRRNAFENSERSRAPNGGALYGRGFGEALDRLLPDDVKDRALRIGNESILPYEDALAAITIATDNRIAILGFDSGEVLDDGFRAFDYSGYDGGVEFIGDWNHYVTLMNARAADWIREHRLPKNHGYILTSASEEEVRQLAKNRQP